MTNDIDAVIRNAITPIVSTCIPYMLDDADNHATEYCTFNYSEFGGLFAGSTADVITYVAQLHYFCPKKTDPNAKKRQIRNALITAGFTVPSVLNASDSEGQHYIFDFRYVDDGGLHGNGIV